MVPDERAADSRAAVRRVHHDRHGKLYGRGYSRLSLHAPVDSTGHTFPRRQVSAVQARLVFLADAFYGFVKRSCPSLPIYIYTHIHIYRVIRKSPHVY